MITLRTRLRRYAVSAAAPGLFRIAMVCILLVSAQGCLYRQDVQQGNEITREMVEQVKPGMSKREVIKALGFPLINDPFNKNRWDYYYSIKKGLSSKAKHQSVTLQFDGDLLHSMKIALPEKKDSATGES